MTTTDPASMGGPLSEAERIAEIQARLDAFHLHAGRPPWDEHVSRARDALERNAPADLAYLLGELDDAQRLFDALGSEAAEELKAAHAALTATRVRVGVLEGQLATAQAEVVIRDGAIVGRDKAIDSLEAWRRNWNPLVDAHMKRCSGCDACDSEDGDDA